MIVWIDCETTGLDPNEDFIVQIGAIAGNTEDGFDELIMPPFFPPGYNIDAGRVTGISREQLENNALSMEEGFEVFTTWLKKYIRPSLNSKKKAFMGGKNIGFDRDFMEVFFRSNGEELRNYFWPTLMDVDVPMGRLFDLKAIELDNFRLGTYAKALGVKLYNAHDAFADIKATRDIFYKAEQKLAEVIKGD